MVDRQKFTKELAYSPRLRDGTVGRSGKVFDMRGMLPPSEARMRMCVMQVGKRGRWTYRDWARWRFLWKFFPWYAREMRYRGDFCIAATCMVLGGRRQEEARLLLGGDLADTAHDVAG
jgi:hypothetical protein